MPKSTPEAQREYQRLWVQARRRQWIEDQGGACVACGSTESLEVDHIDPQTKTCNPRNIWSRNIGFRQMELAKCQVLCRECHIGKSREQFEGPHGCVSRYNRGCRCLVCKAGNAAKQRNYRARMRIASDPESLNR